MIMEKRKTKENLNTIKGDLNPLVLLIKWPYI